MSSRWCTRLLLATVTALLLSSTAALADPPARVARISFIGGAVSFRPASLDEWSAATLNYPLTVGDHVWTDRGARGELQLGSTVVRIAPLTEFSVLNLDDHMAQFRVTQGALVVRVRAFTDSDVMEFDTPTGAASVLRAGLYRVDVTEAGDASTVTVREGEADIAAGTTAFPLRRDQSAVLAGVDGSQPDVRSAIPIDEFEDWSLTRDRRADSLQAARYVSPEMIGYEDLDANGSWQVVADYGPVWLPRVGAEWVPYRFGHWAWVEPWGWTWIDDAPWGFAPFHYGRWAFLPSRGWAWVPGTIVARPVYAPALVAFVGDANWNVSVQLGSAPIGWFPLGPREVYVPAYRVTPDYVRRVNVAHVTNVNVTNINVTNITYVNRTVPGAMTAVSRETFVQARPVAAAAVAIPSAQARAGAVVAVAAVAPLRSSVVGPAQRAATPPAAAVTRQVVVRTPPPPAPPPFAAKEAALAQHPGQPVEAPTANATRAQTAPTPHPLVRTIASPRPSVSVPSPAPARAPAPTVALPIAPPTATAPSNAAPSAPRQIPPPATAPPLGASPAGGRSASPQASPDLAARHAQENAEINARHAQERAALQAKHDREQRASEASQRAQLQERHQQEMKALQARQKQERDATHQRQQDELKKKGVEPR
jgi:hypothetical protein